MPTTNQRGGPRPVHAWTTFAVALVAVGLAGNLVAQAAPAPVPSTAQPEPATLAERIDAMFRGCSRPGSPGAVVLVARGGTVLHARGYGLADLEREAPLTVESVFDIGSTSKQFTAACVLLLAQDGELALSDGAREHVPELPECCAPVTLRHLVLHTSGIPDYIGLMGGEHQPEDRTTAADALTALARVEALAFAPGSQWAYSNSNYFLLAQIVERVSGETMATFARRRIFAPLGMNATHVHDDATMLVKNRALGYSRARAGWRWNFSNWEQTGDGAVFTTVGDLLKWAGNFDSGTVGGAALLAAMGERGALDGGKAIDYGMGLMFGELEGKPVVTHGGAWAAYRAELLRVPSEKLVVVCLCNRDDLAPQQLARRIALAALRSP